MVEMTGGVLSDKAILAAMEKGDIVINPFNPERLTGTTYDVSIAPEFLRLNEFSPDTIVTPHDPSKVYTKPIMAKTITAWKEETGMKDLGEKETRSRGILLAPFERVLGHTVEFIGSTVPWITTEIRARSTAVRWGSCLLLDAGLGNPGYWNSWTVEIINLNRFWYFLPIDVEPLGQIFFKPVIDPSPIKATYYQAERASLEELRNSWKPENMLPKPLI